MSSLRNVVLVDGARTAFARGGKGKLVATRLDEAGSQVIRALLDRNPKVKDSMIEDAGLGNVGGAGEFTGLGIMARLAGLPLETCSFNSNRQCGSSMVPAPASRAVPRASSWPPASTMPAARSCARCSTAIRK